MQWSQHLACSRNTRAELLPRPRMASKNLEEPSQAMAQGGGTTEYLQVKTCLLMWFDHEHYVGKLRMCGQRGNGWDKFGHASR